MYDFEYEHFFRDMESAPEELSHEAPPIRERVRSARSSRRPARSAVPGQTPSFWAAAFMVAATLTAVFPHLAHWFVQSEINRSADFLEAVTTVIALGPLGMSFFVCAPLSILFAVVGVRRSTSPDQRRHARYTFGGVAMSTVFFLFCNPRIITASITLFFDMLKGALGIG